MREIKAIETEYNGMLFRSRLEARWAVFFDAAGEKYEYEPDGFMLDGIGYVPDFYLPGLDLYVEVKPSREGAFLEISKTLGLIGTGRIRSLMVLSHFPEGVNLSFAYPVIFKLPVTNDIVVEDFVFAKGRNGGIRLFPLGRHIYFDDSEKTLFSPSVGSHNGDFRDFDLHECITKAKAYRFD